MECETFFIASQAKDVYGAASTIVNFMKKDTKTQISYLFLLIWIVAIGIPIFWILNFIFALNLKYIKDETFGQIGDIFGVTNSLISVFTVILIGVGVYLQREELERTKLSIKEQEIENRFFKLIELLNQIVSDFDIKKKNSDDVLYKGKDVFWFYKNRFEILIKYLHFDVKNSDNFNEKFDAYFKTFITQKIVPKLRKTDKKIDVKFTEHKKSYSGDVTLRPLELMHYFRTVYVILKFIDEEISLDIDKEFFVRILRSQLSEYELHLISYNALSKYA